MLVIDSSIPHVTHLRTLGRRLQAIFLTHGHEDHIGALPYILGEFDVPVYGTPLTIGFVRSRLREHGIAATPACYRSEPIEVGTFAVEAFAARQPIPDSV